MPVATLGFESLERILALDMMCDMEDRIAALERARPASSVARQKELDTLRAELHELEHDYDELATLTGRRMKNSTS